MPTYHQFEELPVWGAAIGLGTKIFRLTEHESFRYKGDLVNQIRRAVLSVSNNIAEGFERGTTNDLINFLYIARGSAGETRSMLRFAVALGEMKAVEPQIQALALECESVSRQIRGWLDSLQNSDIKGTRYLNDETRKGYEGQKRRAAFMDLIKEKGWKPSAHEAASAIPTCPLCGKPMIKRTSQGGQPFWGCSSFPACKGSRPIA